MGNPIYSTNIFTKGQWMTLIQINLIITIMLVKDKCAFFHIRIRTL